MIEYTECIRCNCTIAAKSTPQKLTSDKLTKKTVTFESNGPLISVYP